MTARLGQGGLIIKAVRKGHRVVLVNVATDYSTWCVTKGREKEITLQYVMIYKPDRDSKRAKVEIRFYMPNSIEAPGVSVRVIEELTDEVELKVIEVDE